MPTGIYIKTKQAWDKGLTKKTDKRLKNRGVFADPDERARKIGISHLGMKHSIQSKKKMSFDKKNRWADKEYRKHMSEVHKGQKGYWTGKKRPDATGENNRKWKGDSVSYRALHSWVERNLGKSDTCENCGANGLSGRKIQWANKDHKYRRNLQDWFRLCVPCHKAYDKGRRAV